MTTNTYDELPTTDVRRIVTTMNAARTVDNTGAYEKTEKKTKKEKKKKPEQHKECDNGPDCDPDKRGSRWNGRCREMTDDPYQTIACV